MDQKFQMLSASMKNLTENYSAIYDEVSKNNDWKNPYRDKIAKEIPELIKACTQLEDPYIVVGGYGKGRWTAVPWIAVLDTRITDSPQKGVYIVYLLNKDEKELYLSFATAATEVMEKRKTADGKKLFVGVVGNNNAKMKQALTERVNSIRETIPIDSFRADGAIHTGSTGYDYGSICYKRYSLDDFPSGEELIEDLFHMLQIYKDYYDVYYSETKHVGDHKTPEENNDCNISIRDRITAKTVISNIKSFMLKKGFVYSDGVVENFFLSLKSKPFVILAGISGTGKTKLVKLFAEAIGARYKMVAVRPDWSDSTDLFGHVDLNGRFVPGAMLDFIKECQKDPDKPYILCLDEMNLARVEYYLSDFLSIIETREMTGDGIVSDPLISLKQYGADDDAREEYGEIQFPQNLYLVGTVNMDETTFPFSKKVLDRANTIEFNSVKLDSMNSEIQEAESMVLDNEFLRTNYLILAHTSSDKEYVDGICAELQIINEILQKSNAHVGYRVRDEIVFYMLNNHKTKLLDEDEAMDNEIMQKILPRIQGSSTSIKSMLCKLFIYLTGNPEGLQIQNNDTASEMKKRLENGNVRFPKSAEKVAFMVGRYEDDGFTSYWL